MKEIGRSAINWDALIKVELTLKELQMITDALCVAKYSNMDRMSNSHTPYYESDVLNLHEEAKKILKSYK